MNRASSPYTILLVDDNPKYLYRIGQFIWDSPHAGTIMRADDAETAVTIVKEYQPSVIFLDLHLPGANGLWLLARIKQMSPDSRVYMLTNCEGNQYRQRALALGAEEFLDKTYDFAKIPMILETLSTAV